MLLSSIKSRVVATLLVSVCASSGCATNHLHPLSILHLEDRQNRQDQSVSNSSQASSRDTQEVRLVSNTENEPENQLKAVEGITVTENDVTESDATEKDLTENEFTEIEELPPAEGSLDLSEVQQSVLMHYPQLAIVQRQRIVAAGKQLASLGDFDLKLKAESINQPLSFYKNYRHGVTLEQADFRGGKGFVKYRIGDGFFEPWYKERETDEGGEFSVGYAFALAKDRMIDAKRAKIQLAEIERQAVEPLVRSQVLQFIFEASSAYWSWVAAGQGLLVQEQLLKLAEDRNSKIKRQVELGDLPDVELIDNERLIASRRAKLLEQERKLQAAGIKLSLYNRDASGRPVLPTANMLPNNFPGSRAGEIGTLDGMVARASVLRPELVIIDLDRASTDVDLALARNAYLPRIDTFVTVKKDVGRLASSTGDKNPTELIAGLTGELPIQRSEARGLTQAALGKLSQLAVKRTFAVEKITAEIQDALSALTLAQQRIVQAEKAVELAQRSEAVERRKFELGDSTLVLLNIREEATVNAKLSLIDTQADYFKAVAQYENAVGELPLEIHAVVTDSDD